jgi:GMP synthase (glutamine-hydrolysing)
MKTALIIRHAAPESLADNYTRTLKEHEFTLEPLDIFELAPEFQEFTPIDPKEISLTLILGGPLSANDDHPALRQEMAYFREAITLGKPVFGVCLGVQLMAKALGGVVEPTGGYQFGLRKIDVAPEGDADPVFSKITIPLVPTLHGECFSIPPGATRLAEGFMLCKDGKYRKISMAFRYGSSYGFQFEPQLTLEELKMWNRELAGDYQLMGSRLTRQRKRPGTCGSSANTRLITKHKCGRCSSLS